MIRTAEALQLASTKLKTRKIRLIVTVIITSLLFGVLVFLASLVDGTVRSVASFNQEGYGNRFFVQATPLTYQMGPALEGEIKAELGPKQTELVNRKKAAAKKLNITYDETTDQTLPLSVYKAGPNNTETYPNFTSPLTAAFVKERNNSIPGSSYEEFAQLAKKSGAVNVFRGTQSNGMFSMVYSGSMSSSQATVIVDGKEDLRNLQGGFRSGPMEPKGIGSLTTLGWRSSDAELLMPFLLPGQSLVTGKDGSIPVIAPFSAAEEILGLKPLPSTATPEQKVERLVEVRKGVTGTTAQLCYRNGASVELISKADQQIKEIEANKNKKDYQMPGLLYQMPAQACGVVTIKSDKRTAEEKKADNNQAAFDKEFGQSIEPAQGIIAVRIVGLTPDVNYDFSLSPVSILSSLLTSSMGTGWISPTKPVDQSVLASELQGGKPSEADRSRSTYFAEFKTLEQMKTFIKSQECDLLEQFAGPDGVSRPVDISGSGNSTVRCIDQKKVFTVSPYGNSAGAVEELRDGIWKFARYAVLVIVVIAALIMMGNVGKIIADSRRETAVFRALGAKRMDIAQIYLTYTLLISILIVFAALLLGSIGAYLLSLKYSPDLSVMAVLAYNAQDVHKVFSLFGFNPLYVLAIAGLVVLAGLLSAWPPLSANTRRNPIRDMRDDT